MNGAVEETDRFARFSDLSYYRHTNLGHNFGIAEVERIEGHISKFTKEGDDPIVLHINSMGGSVRAARHLRGVISDSGVPVYGLVLWQAYSAAFYVLQACRQRLVLPDTTLAMHINFADLRITPDLSPWKAAARAWGISGKIRRSRNAIVRDYRKRLDHLTTSDILGMMRKTHSLTAAEALECGLIDAVVEGRAGGR